MALVECDMLLHFGLRDDGPGLGMCDDVLVVDAWVAGGEVADDDHGARDERKDVLNDAIRPNEAGIDLLQCCITIVLPLDF